MELVIRSEHGEAEVTVTGAIERLEAGELVAHVLGGHPPSSVVVDGRTIPGDATLTGGLVGIGSVIEPTPTDPPSERIGPAVELTQVAGFGAGSTIELAPGSYRLGPSRRVNLDDLADAPVEEPLLRLEIDDDAGVVASVDDAAGQLVIDGEVADGPTRWNTGLLSVDGRVFTHRRVGDDPSAPDDGRAARTAAPVDGRVRLERPTRPPLDPAPPTLVVPSEHDAPALRRRRRPPVARRSGGGAGTHHRETRAASAFRMAADDARRADERWRRRRQPHLGELARRIERLEPTMWERRAGDLDAFTVSLGLADLAWRPVLDRPNDSIPDADRIIEHVGSLRCVPVEADLRDERGLAVVGGHDVATDVARAIMLSLCTTHGPADLDVVVVTSHARRADWEWAKWLPHTRSDGVVRIMADDESLRAWADGFLHGVADDEERSRRTLVVSDDVASWGARDAPLRPLLGDPSLPVRLLALAETPAETPAICTTVVRLDDARTGRHRDGTPGVRVEYVADQRRVDSVAPSALTGPVALGLARRMARLDDPECPVPNGSTLPTDVPLLGLLDQPRPTGDLVIERWSSGTPETRRPVATIGVGARGATSVDLAADGPHALIAGATGSGRSELLRSLVAGLA
ncbi:MAG: hypothetical protein AAGG08_16745, partial [Actinomycetota bacterium]